LSIVTIMSYRHYRHDMPPFGAIFPCSSTVHLTRYCGALRERDVRERRTRRPSKWVKSCLRNDVEFGRYWIFAQVRRLQVPPEQTSVYIMLYIVSSARRDILSANAMGLAVKLGEREHVAEFKACFWFRTCRHSVMPISRTYSAITLPTSASVSSLQTIQATEDGQIIVTTRSTIFILVRFFDLVFEPIIYSCTVRPDAYFGPEPRSV
jgi:hypothetical protein